MAWSNSITFDTVRGVSLPSLEKQKKTETKVIQGRSYTNQTNRVRQCAFLSTKPIRSTGRASGIKDGILKKRGSPNILIS